MERRDESERSLPTPRGPEGRGPGHGPIIYPRKRHPGRLRGLIIAATVIVSLVVLVVAAVYVLSGTDWGRERVRSFAQNTLNGGIVHGHATIGRLSGNLLTGITAHDVAITDSAGHPFVAVESFTADYSIIGLIKKHIWLDNVTLLRPIIVLDPGHGGIDNGAVAGNGAMEKDIVLDFTPAMAMQARR